MLLIRELVRVVRSITGYALRTRRPWLLVAVICIALTTLVGASVTVVGPVVVYPFL